MLIKKISPYERRTSIRVISNISLNLHFKNPLTEKEQIKIARIINISKLGLVLVTDTPLPNINSMDLEIFLPRPYQLLKTKSQITWRDDEQFYYGVRFVDIKEEDKFTLEDHINKIAKINEQLILGRRKLGRRNFDNIPRTQNEQRKHWRRKVDKYVSEKKEFPITLDEYIGDLIDPISNIIPSQSKVIPPLAIKEFPLLVDGKYLKTKNFDYFPYTDKVITDFENTRKTIQKLKAGEVPENYRDYVYAKYYINEEETNFQAIQSAHRAFQEFKDFSLRRRKKILENIHDRLVEKKEELINLMVIEGHPRKLAEWELSGMIKSIEKQTVVFYKSEMFKKIGEEKNELLYLTRKPNGVICVSPPHHAPCSGSAIAYFSLLGGNTLVVKPPLMVPLSTIFLLEDIITPALDAVGVPKGAVNVIVGDSKKIMDEWLTNPLVSCILYIGDSKRGLEIGERAYQKGKKPILELSGNDFMLVWKDADIDQAVKSLLDGFLGSTQICMVPKKALIHQEIYPIFEKRFVAETKKLKVGLPTHPETCLAPVAKITEFYEFLKDALDKGADILCGGNRVNYQGEKDEQGIYLIPTVISCPDSIASLLLCVQEENFFPLIPLIKVTGNDKTIFNKMVNIVNSNEYGLRTSVWTNSRKYIWKFAKFLNNNGLLRINSRHTDFSLYLSTHGGIKKTGGPFGEMNYVWQKTTHLQGISITNLR